MHFWIDKRSQACSISGRYRAPGLASSRHCGGSGVWGGAGAGGCKVGGLVMVTPVHRFQPIESAQILGGVRRAHYHRQRLLHNQGNLLQPQAVPHATSSRLHVVTPGAESGRRDATESSQGLSGGRGGGGMSLLPQGVGPGLASQQVLLRRPAPRREGSMKCAILAYFLMTAFCVSFSRFYNSGQEVLLLFCIFLMIPIPILGCAICFFNARSRGWSFGARTPSNQAQPAASGPRSALIEIPEEETSGTADSLMLAQHTQPWVNQQQQPNQQHQATQTNGGEPPPYHIAIWLPQPESTPHIVPPAQTSQEVPPPSYDKATS